MPTSKKHFDVIICGAGPAGSTCALALTGSGLKIALIDKSNFPRDKICGDAIAAYARKVLESIHPKFADAFDLFDKRYLVNTYRLFGPNGKYVDVSSDEYGMISRRIDWDNFLFNLAAGEPHVTCFLDTTVNNVHRNDGEVDIEIGNEIFTSKIVIGCDGAHSVVARDLAKPTRDLHHHSAAVRAYYKNVEGLAPQTFELHFMEGILPGYFWIFPLPDNTVNVGLGCSSYQVSNEKLNLRKTLSSIITDHPKIKERFKRAERISEIEGYGLPLGSRKVQMSGDNFMLCGDAASLIDPLTGEGIGPAMVSGRYAGWQAKKCFEQNNFSSSFMKQYDQQVYAKFWNNHRRRYHIQQQIISRPRLVNGLIGLANSSSMAHRLLSKMLG